MPRLFDVKHGSPLSSRRKDPTYIITYIMLFVYYFAFYCIVGAVLGTVFGAIGTFVSVLSSISLGGLVELGADGHDFFVQFFHGLFVGVLVGLVVVENFFGLGDSLFDGVFVVIADFVLIFGGHFFGLVDGVF